MGTMPTYQQLRRLFTDISLATLAAQTAGCGSETGSISRTGFEMTSCDPEGQLAAVTPAVASDYLAIRRIYVVPQGQSAPPPDPEIEAEVGVACDTASDPVTCNDALLALPAVEGFDPVLYSPEPYPSRYQLVWTRGDEVGSVTNQSELLAFLGTIDSAEEALLVARFAQGQNLTCGPNTRLTEEGFEVITSTGVACGPGTSRSEHVLVIAGDGTVTVRRSVVVEIGDPNCAIGRLTDGVLCLGPARHDDLGSYFAQMASLEAAAVVAFERLARELQRLSAPAQLVARALDAASDERRHAREVGALARAFGGTPAALPPVAELPLRGALALALENASEGCVRETYGALVATHQAHSATDERVREVLARVAADETGHAALSWDLAAWLDTQLSTAERALVRAARAEAIARFGAPHDNGLSPSAASSAGLPSASVAGALFTRLEQRLWAQAA